MKPHLVILVPTHSFRSVDRGVQFGEMLIQKGPCSWEDMLRLQTRPVLSPEHPKEGLLPLSHPPAGCGHFAERRRH